ncbi:PDZ domain-containing protein [Lignipirellula cremea]|uniref:PDZ domain-containing protein n=1 Tax=Lignipirellula cremea TaxID=2528010 RepID=A0A518DYT2_9BACT|nr:PDZ domain-containing protein [Lignipirellula cremea]QDU97000.1 hypothetical protein Pla8534_48250 [Lignipirellula cremea]
MKITLKRLAAACLAMAGCFLLAAPSTAQSPYGPYGQGQAPYGQGQNPYGQGQTPAAAPGAAPAAAPTVIHIHHHYGPAAPSANLISGNQASTAWNYGWQPGTGTIVTPWKQNWGHLGFTGYLGQHGGGVDLDVASLDVFTGLVVDTVTPDSPATQLGLVPGDFIRSINGTAVDNYKQVTNLFEQTEQQPGGELTMEVWNPHTRRTSTLTAKIAD